MTTAEVKPMLEAAMNIEGAIGVALVDYKSGMALGMSGGGGLNLELAAAGNSEVVNSKMKVMAALGLKDQIEDILITLSSQYHLIRLVKGGDTGLMIYLALNKTQANLAMARHQLTQLESRFIG